ncbi:MAG TPA: hypothetical protein VGK10_00225 [Prolixibacteraceae bacterium]|jgi:hypothetical protein
MSRKHILLSILIVGIIALSIYGIGKLILFFRVDACLDKGGRWNYKLNICETVENGISESNTSYYWHIAEDTILNKEYLIKGALLDSIAHSSAELIGVLNKRDAKCKIEYLGQMGDTIHIRILNDEVLTEQMGSTGSFCHLGETVFTLTEIDSIKFVQIDMEQGSHASPGVYTRAGFKELEKE